MKSCQFHGAGEENLAVVAFGKATNVLKHLTMNYTEIVSCVGKCHVWVSERNIQNLVFCGWWGEGKCQSLTDSVKPRNLLSIDIYMNVKS